MFVVGCVCARALGGVCKRVLVQYCVCVRACASLFPPPQGALYPLPSVQLMHPCLRDVQVVTRSGNWQCGYSLGSAPPMPWAPANHHHFPTEFKQCVWTVLLARSAARTR